MDEIRPVKNCIFLVILQVATSQPVVIFFNLKYSENLNDISPVCVKKKKEIIRLAKQKRYHVVEAIEFYIF